MKFIEDVFTCGIDDMPTVIYSLKNGIPVFNIYLLCVHAEKPAVIVSSSEYFRRGEYNDTYVAGICSGKYNAFRIYAQAVEVAVSKNWDFDRIGQMLIEGN